MITDKVSAATATINLSENQIASPFGKSVKKIDLILDGTGYIDTPTVAITTASPSGINATAVAIMTSKYGQQGKSIERILITNPGIGYTQIPEVRIISSSGSGAIATAILGDKVLGPIGIVTSGFGYVSSPTAVISPTSSTGDNALIESFINSSGSVTSASYVNAGSDIPLVYQLFSKTQ